MLYVADLTTFQLNLSPGTIFALGGGLILENLEGRN